MSKFFLELTMYMFTYGLIPSGASNPSNPYVKERTKPRFPDLKEVRMNEDRYITAIASFYGAVLYSLEMPIPITKENTKRYKNDHISSIQRRYI